MNWISKLQSIIMLNLFWLSPRFWRKTFHAVYCYQKYRNPMQYPPPTKQELIDAIEKHFTFTKCQICCEMLAEYEENK